MDRKKIYPGQIPLETDLLETNRFALVGLGKLAEALFGNTTFVRGLECAPTAPASMRVKIAPGEIYCPQNLDDTAYSSLSADTTHQIVKQGLLFDAVLLSCPAPATAGMSVNYLVQAAFQEVDSQAVVLPYYNASNPPQAYSGPENTGSAQSTVRKGVCTVLAKPGIAATSGTQQTPPADPGYVGLCVVTVMHGQRSISAGNIAALAGAPFLPEGGLASYWHQALPTKADKESVAAGIAALERKIGAVPKNNNLQAEIDGKADKGALAELDKRVTQGLGKYLPKSEADFAKKAGDAAQTFQVADATEDGHALNRRSANSLYAKKGDVQLGQVRLARFAASAVSVVPPGIYTIYVSGCAGGGGGGGSKNATSSVSGGSGGGGAGESILRKPFSVTPGQSISITIGGAGSGGVQGNGTAGGDTVVGSLITLKGGGGGGGGGGAGNNSSGGLGGTGYPNGSHGSDVNSGASSIGTGNGGAGASCPFGGGGGAGRSGTTAGIAGNAASGFGSGGGGGGGVTGGTTGNGGIGGAGSPGLVIIEW